MSALLLKFIPCTTFIKSEIFNIYSNPPVMKMMHLHYQGVLLHQINYYSPMLLNMFSDIAIIISNIMWLYIFGFFVHAIFFVSVFDIYFRTPIIHGMEPQSSPLPPVAKRLVLVVGDGLRADSFYNLTDGKSRAPYLR